MTGRDLQRGWGLCKILLHPCFKKTSWKQEPKHNFALGNVHFLFFIPSWFYRNSQQSFVEVSRTSHINFQHYISMNLIHLEETQQQVELLAHWENSTCGLWAQQTEIYMYCIYLLNPGPGCLSLPAKWFSLWGEESGRDHL